MMSGRCSQEFSIFFLVVLCYNSRQENRLSGGGRAFLLISALLDAGP